jgi:hypothetical protein
MMRPRAIRPLIALLAVAIVALVPLTLVAVAQAPPAASDAEHASSSSSHPDDPLGSSTAWVALISSLTVALQTWTRHQAGKRYKDGTDARVLAIESTIGPMAAQLAELHRFSVTADPHDGSSTSRMRLLHLEVLNKLASVEEQRAGSDAKMATAIGHLTTMVQSLETRLSSVEGVKGDGERPPPPRRRRQGGAA